MASISILAALSHLPAQATASPPLDADTRTESAPGLTGDGPASGTDFSRVLGHALGHTLRRPLAAAQAGRDATPLSASASQGSRALHGVNDAEQGDPDDAVRSALPPHDTLPASGHVDDEVPVTPQVDPLLMAWPAWIAPLPTLGPAVATSAMADEGPLPGAANLMPPVVGADAEPDGLAAASTDAMGRAAAGPDEPTVSDTARTPSFWSNGEVPRAGATMGRIPLGDLAAISAPNSPSLSATVPTTVPSKAPLSVPTPHNPNATARPDLEHRGAPVDQPVPFTPSAAMTAMLSSAQPLSQHSPPAASPTATSGVIPALAPTTPADPAPSIAPGAAPLSTQPGIPPIPTDRPPIRFPPEASPDRRIQGLVTSSSAPTPSADRSRPDEGISITRPTGTPIGASGPSPNEGDAVPRPTSPLPTGSMPSLEVAPSLRVGDVPSRDDSAAAAPTLPPHLDDPDFPRILGVQVLRWAREGVESVQLDVRPAEMGPVSIRIALDGQGARLDVGAASSDARRVIEASLPELATALQSAGLTLVGGSVSDQLPLPTPGSAASLPAGTESGAGHNPNPHQNPAPTPHRSASPMPDTASGSAADLSPAERAGAPRPRTRDNLLDLYA